MLTSFAGSKLNFLRKIKKKTRNLPTHFYYYDKHRHFEYICKLFILFMQLNHEHFFLFLSVIFHIWKKKQILATCIKNVVVAYKSFSLVFIIQNYCKIIDQTLTIFLSFSFFYIPYRFRTCLKMADSADATMVGKLFFNIVQTKCFVLKPEKYCKEHSWWGSCVNEGVRKRAHLRTNKKF